MKLKYAFKAMAMSALAATTLALTGVQAEAASTATATARLHKMKPGDHLNAARKQLAGRDLGARLKVSAARMRAAKARNGSAADSTDFAPEAPTAGTASLTNLKTCTTNSADVFTPSDITGAASATNLVVTTNDAIAVYRIDGCATLSRESLEDFVNDVFPIPTQEVFDPRVVFDKASGRFIMTAETFDDVNTDQYQYVAVSTDDTGTDWNIYQIALSEEASSTLFCKQAAIGFWDYPMLGYSSDRVFISANDFVSGEPGEAGENPGRAPGDPVGAIISIDKTPMLTGGKITMSCNTNLQFNVATPIIKGPASKGYFLSPDGFGAGVDLAAYSLNFGVDAASDVFATEPRIDIPDWSAAPNARQPNGQRLDTLDGRFQAPTIQIGNKMWNVHTVNVSNHAKWRLYRFTIGGSGFTTKVTTAKRTILIGDDNLFNPSVDTRSANPSDPAFVTFTRTIPGVKSTTGYAAMMVAKGPNASKTGWSTKLISKSLNQYVETGFRGGSTPCNQSDIGTCRWGDYSSTQIDPVDDTTAWGFNQLIIGRTSKNWTTKGAHVK